MFEAAEVGRKIAKSEFKRREPELHTRLLDAQRALRETDIPVIVVISGVEGAGKGALVNRLNEWLDSRGMQTFAFWDESDEERERPFFWRFWRTLPERGTIALMFGSWYTRPIINRVFGKIDPSAYEKDLTRIAEFERMLTKDKALVFKIWCHMSKKAQRKRLARESGHALRDWKLSPLARRYSKHYDAFARVSEQAIRATDTGECPWHIVEAEDPRYLHLTVGMKLLDALNHRLTREASVSAAPDERAVTRRVGTGDETRTVLEQVDLGRRLSDKRYRRQLAEYQRELNGLVWKARKKGIDTVALFEGWDAGGKGGAIRRTTAAMDARLFRVISVAAPTDEEKAHHYLWRFWRHLPRAGHVTIYDRSWYGRVLVERVEGFAPESDWMRAYQEINDFEQQLCEHGAVLLKFWIHIDKDEQLRRFKERERIPWKMHKITDEDWRNREKWDAYEAAVNDMVMRTSTEYAPWTLIPGNDKKFARVEVLKTFRRGLKAAL